MGSRLTRLLVVIATACLGIAAGPVFAKTDPAPPATPFPVDPALAAQTAKANAECFSCHSKAGMEKPPRTDLDIAKLKETRVEPGVYKGSNHGHMDCAQCHGKGYGEYPHLANARDQLAPCDECHAAKVIKIDTQFDLSVHAKNVKEKFTCNSCHDVHVALLAEKLRDPRKIVAQDNHMCLECHNPASKGGTYWLKAEDKVPFDDSKFKAGDEVASIMVAPFVGDRGDVKTVAKWKNGKWTMELSRKLVTGSKTDVNFTDLAKTYAFGIAVFDNAQVRHAYVQEPLMLSFK